MEYLKKAKPADRKRQQDLEAEVHAIIRDVSARGDRALIEYNTQFDGIRAPVCAFHLKRSDGLTISLPRN